MAGELTRVSVSEFNRKPGGLLDRVVTGERFVVCRHRRPIATLQPLDGLVLQPNGAEHDVTGFPMGDVSAELEKLSEIQKQLLGGRLQYGRLLAMSVTADPHDGEQVRRDIDDLLVRGLARKAERGTVITGRGMVLREELFARRGEPDCDWIR